LMGGAASTSDMAAMPLTALELRRGSYDVAHAFHFTTRPRGAVRPARVYSVWG